MAVTLLASNINAAANKWVPYYWKTFALGSAVYGAGSTDGNTYITQTTGDSEVVMLGFCLSSHNCGYYYTLTFDSDNFIVKKYTLDDTLIDTIYASETGEGDDGKWWNKTSSTITIDTGVVIAIQSTSAYDDEDVYKITLPSADTMDRRKIYHGGYSTFMRMPYTEGIVYHSDIIPCDLKDKGINVNLGAYFTDSNLTAAKSFLSSCKSKEDSVGNSAVTCGLEWSLNPDASHSNVAVAVTGVNFAVENWALGTIYYNDISPDAFADVATNAHSSISDVIPDDARTGDISTLNTSVSGRAGHAKIYLAYNTGAGTPTIASYNQIWPVIITLT